MLHIHNLFSFYHTLVVDISNDTLYTSSHIYIVHNISSFDHATVKLNAGILTGCNPFSWFPFIEQPSTIASFVCSSLSQQAYITIHSYIYLSREHGQTKEKSWCCMHALSQPVDYYFREASEMIIVVRFFVRLYSSLVYPIYFSVRLYYAMNRQTSALASNMCACACLCLQSYEQADVFSSSAYTQYRIVIAAAAAI